MDTNAVNFSLPKQFMMTDLAAMLQVVQIHMLLILTQMFVLKITHHVFIYSWMY